MGSYWPPVDQQNAVITGALRVIAADHYSDPTNPHEDAEREYAAEQLAIAARDLTLAVSAKAPDDQPIGWAGKPPTAIRHVYLDTEFMRNDLTESGLVSIALTDDQDVDYYAVNWDMNGVAVYDDDWMRENVWPYLPRGADGDVNWNHSDVRHYGDIREQIAAYFADTTATETRLYARNGAQDMVRLHGLWDHNWTVMPEAIPRWFTDIHQLIAAAGVDPDSVPAMDTGAHHPLEDARHNRTVRHYLAAL
jgi:hypothetical protein